MFALHIRVVLVVRRSIFLPVIHSRSAAFAASQYFFVEQHPLDTVNVHRFILSLNAFIYNLSFATLGFRIYPFVSAYPFDLQCEHIQEEVGQHRLRVNVMHVHTPCNW